jgi:hypothetical protein
MASAYKKVEVYGFRSGEEFIRGPHDEVAGCLPGADPEEFWVLVLICQCEDCKKEVGRI